MKFNKRQIGRKIRIINRPGSRFRNDDWPENVWCEDGTIATIVEFHPRIPGSGIILGTDEEGNTIRDTGLDPWHVVEIVPGARIVIDEEDFKTRWEWAN